MKKMRQKSEKDLGNSSGIPKEAFEKPQKLSKNLEKTSKMREDPWITSTQSI